MILDKLIKLTELMLLCLGDSAR